MNSITLNESVCNEVGQLISVLGLRSSFYQRPFLTVKAPTETRLRGYYYAVAVCHQTYHLQNQVLGLYGWDYLEHVFTELMEQQDSFLLPGKIASAGLQETCRKLAGLFSPDGSAGNTTLDRLEERANMLRELDRFAMEKFNSSLEELNVSTHNRLLNSGRGYYEILPSVPAFTDPMKKKISFLLKLLEEAGLAEIRDAESFIPIMDYHMQRVLLRMGCVEVTDPTLHSKLSMHLPLDTDEEIRSACIQAFRIIAGISGKAITKLNDYFWSLGRSCCNTEPLCRFHHCEKEPCTFNEIVDLREHRSCLFSPACKGYSDEKYRKLWQPVVETHFY